MKNILFVCSILLLLAACNSPAPSSATTDNPSKSCFTTALVKDMNGLDGCTFLLELDNGDRLLPLEIKGKNFDFKNNQLVEIGYKIVPDAMSVCMAETQAVNVTCIKLVALTGGIKPSKPVKVECAELNAPYDKSWMKDNVIRIKPRQIDRYKYLDGWAYHLVNNETEYIIDCQNTTLCSGKRGNSKCKEYLSRMTEKFTIWVVNN